MQLFLDIHKYGKAFIWTERIAELIPGYEKVPDGRPGYAERQWSRYYINSAIALEGLGRKDEAAKAYQLFQKTSFSRSAEGNILSSNYLGLAGRWQESADNFSNLNTLMEEQNFGYSLENIQKMLLKKFEANRQAGRMDSAKAVGMEIIEHLDSAITQSRRADAIEQEAVHQKEQEIAAEREHNMRGRPCNIERFILFYNSKRPHYSIGLQTPDDAHEQTGEQKKMWKTKIYQKNDQSLQINP